MYGEKICSIYDLLIIGRKRCKIPHYFVGKSEKMHYSNTKLLLLRLYDILRNETDEQHGITIEIIKNQLSQNSITPDRKSIYSCIDTLEEYGLEIQRPSGKRKDYRLLKSADELELSEIKLLIDTIQASRFLSKAKAEKLVGKLEKLVSKHQAKSLQRQVLISNRVKNMNNSIHYSVDAIHSAINEDSKITFRYFDYNLSKKRVYRHDGKWYEVSPYALIYNNDKYYVVGVADDDTEVRTYRVDKMDSVRSTNEPRQGQGIFEGVDLSTYTQYTFSMYAGTPQNVVLLFENNFLNVAYDRFGYDVRVKKHDENHFQMEVPVAVSPQFYGWLFGLGDKVEILEPAEVREGMKAMLSKIAENYLCK